MGAPDIKKAGINMKWICVILRLILGLVFIVSGCEKLFSPIENFIYALQSYELIYDVELQEAIAIVMPWMELFVGIFLVLGLWTKYALTAVIFMSCGFIFFVGQAMARNLPLTDCGCFGDLAHFPIWVTFLIDWGMLIFSGMLYWKIDLAKTWSLDQVFDK